MGVSKETIIAGHTNRMNLLQNRTDLREEKKEEALLIAMQSLSAIKKISEEQSFNNEVSNLGEDHLGFERSKTGVWYSSKTNQEIGENLGYKVHPNKANEIEPVMISDSKMRAMTKYYKASGYDPIVLENIIGTIYQVNIDSVTQDKRFVGPKEPYTKDFQHFLNLSDKDKLKVVKPWADNFINKFYNPYVKAHEEGKVVGTMGENWQKTADLYNLTLSSNYGEPAFYPIQQKKLATTYIGAVSGINKSNKFLKNQAVSPYPGNLGDSFLMQFNTQGGRAYHVNEFELALVNMYGTQAEEWLLNNAKNSEYYKKHGDYPINENTGAYQLYSGGFGDLAGIAGGVGTAVDALGMANISSPLLSGIGAGAGVLGVGLMVADWIGGAFGAADEATKKQEEINRTMKQLGNTVSVTYDKGQQALENLKEMTTNKVQSFGTDLSDALDSLGGQVKSGWKQTKGLISGGLNQIKDRAVKSLDERFTGQLRDLFKKSEVQFEDIAQNRESQMMDTKFQIGELQRQHDELEDSNDWYENLI